MTSSGDGRGRRALAALADLARGSVRPPTPARLEGGLDALRVRMNTERAERRAVMRRWSLAGAMAMAAALVAVGVLRSERWRAPGAPAPLTYRVEGGSLVDGGYLRESGRDGIKLFFAEGTEFILKPGTRSRLRAVDAAGARIAIEHGTASFQVTPSPSPSIDRRWQVDVGPFLVTVKGTVFTVSWDAASEKFELKLRHGRVTVSGPVSGGEIALRAGQRLVVDLPHGQTLISEQADGWIDAAAGPATQPAPLGEGSSPAPARRPAATSSKLDEDRGWAAAVAAGEFDRILAQASRDGLKKTLSTASSADLQSLADAARYSVRLDLARDTLLAIRRRFPDSRHARDAAFILGRVEEASDGGLARALEWYDEYLARSPNGAFAPEALGRKMTLTSKLKGAAQARPIATEYLTRFPSGPYAGPAQAFLRAQ